MSRLGTRDRELKMDSDIVPKRIGIRLGWKPPENPHSGSVLGSTMPYKIIWISTTLASIRAEMALQTMKLVAKYAQGLLDWATTIPEDIERQKSKLNMIVDGTV